MSKDTKLIRLWLYNSTSSHSHLIVVNNFNKNKLYPVYVFAHEDINRTFKWIEKINDDIIEVYNLKLDYEEQLNESKAYNI